jgi:PKD repeat protein
VNGSVPITVFLVQGVLSGTGTTAGGGQPVRDGTVVSFSTTLGRVQPAEGTTVDGRTVVRLIGDGRSGTAVVTATSGPASESLQMSIGGGSAGVPTMSIQAPLSITASVPSNFTVSVSSGTVASNVSINFGDGTAPVALGSIAGNQSVTHIFPAAGNFTVTANGTSADSSPLVSSTSIAVAPLSVTLTATPTTGNAPVLISFAAQTTQGALIDHFEFDFGDGTGFETFASGTQNHLFASPGTRTVRVVVVPVVGISRTAQINVVIN